MKPTYFDAKNELKKFYGLGLKAVKRKDEKYINFILLNLNELENALKDKFNIDRFGLHILKKDIAGMRFFLISKLKEKKTKETANEKKSHRNTS